jgi:oxazoline/thiazoline dehydrogenase
VVSHAPERPLAVGAPTMWAETRVQSVDPGDALPPSERLVLALCGGVSLTEPTRDELAVTWAWGRLVLRALPEGVLQAFRRLGEGASRHELAMQVLAVDSPSTLARLYYHLGELETRGLLEWSARRAGTPLAVLRPLGETGFHRRTPRHVSIRADRPYVLSSLSFLRRDGRGVVADSPLGQGTVSLEDPLALEVAAGLFQPARVEELTDRVADRLGPGGHPGRSVEEILQLLTDAGIAAQVGPDGGADRDKDARLDLWAFHDLYFHRRSRFGRHEGRFGGTFPHVGRLSPPPAVRPPWGTTRVGLTKPDLVAVHASEGSLGEVMERRASRRSYASRAMSLDQLSTFLYRVARVKDVGSLEVTSRDGRSHDTVEVTSRPYPGGGRAHELELYLALRSCEGVDPGLYHYDPLGHALEAVRSFDPSVQSLLGYACISAQIPEPPPILIVVAARVARVTWKYDAIAYATILKDLGVLYQTMYLVATAMGLAPCALGSGSPDMFADATGLDPLEETSVGEFMLGLPDAEHAAAPLVERSADGG